MSGKQKSDLSYDEKAAQKDIYAIIDKMSREDVAMNHEEMASDMATAEIAERLRDMTPDEWDAMEEATANRLARVAAAEADEDPNMMKYRRQAAKDIRALKAAEAAAAARAAKVAAARARAVRAADRMGADVVLGELPAGEKARLYAYPPGPKWEKPDLKSKDPGSSSRYAKGRKLYKTRNKKSRRGRQGKRTRRARISRRTRRARK
jgi:hypothetical protein